MNDLDIRRRIDLPKNFRGRPGSGNDRWFMRNDASAGMQRFGNEKLGRDVALAYVFFEALQRSDRNRQRSWRSGGRTIRMKSTASIEHG